MDADLYDEFGNYIGPELDSDDEEEDVRPPGQEEEAERSDEDMEKVRCCSSLWHANRTCHSIRFNMLTSTCLG